MGEVFAAEAEADAEEVLRRFHDRDAGIHDIPIDPIRVAHFLGADVYETRLRRDVAGALTSRPGQRPAIFLNETEPLNRKRFTCAHEVGHLWRHKTLEDSDYEYIDLRGPLSSTGRNPDERYANQFAAALLMPAALIRQWADIVDPPGLANRFGVSLEAITYRLVNLGLR